MNMKRTYPVIVIFLLFGSLIGSNVIIVNNVFGHPRPGTEAPLIRTDVIFRKLTLYAEYPSGNFGDSDEDDWIS
jgi:hypothetical protein